MFPAVPTPGSPPPGCVVVVVGAVVVVAPGAVVVVVGVTPGGSVVVVGGGSALLANRVMPWATTVTGLAGSPLPDRSKSPATVTAEAVTSMSNTPWAWPPETNGGQLWMAPVPASNATRWRWA